MSGETQYDVIIVGGGNAALTAALASANEGAKTLMVEKAPEYLRGGNSYFTGGLFRFAYEGLEDILGVLDEMSEEEQAGMQQACSERKQAGLWPRAEGTLLE